MALTRQLRIYRIEEGRLPEFMEGWLHGVRPLRERHGFVVEEAWSVPEEDRFIWIVSYDGPELWTDKEAAYYASPERQMMVPDPAKLIAEQWNWFVEPVVTRPGE
jgi:hypothetical protein